MSYSVQVANPDGKGTHRECPKTHPVNLPEIALSVSYTVREKDSPLRWRLSSDMYDKSRPRGRSSHGDWLNGWKAISAMPLWGTASRRRRIASPTCWATAA